MLEFRIGKGSSIVACLGSVTETVLVVGVTVQGTPRLVQDSI